MFVIDADKYGVSFSLKQCRNFKLDSKKCLRWLLGRGWRRFRLMTYWNEHETIRGEYDFSELDWQLKMIGAKGGVVTLCLGVKQPRWPEYHWPTWTKDLSPEQKTTALLEFLRATIEHVKDTDCIISYQLENEALLSNFGRSIDINRGRLRREFELVRELDNRPVYMSTSNGWGVPLRRPRPTAVGFSIYTTVFAKGAYRTTIQKPWLHRVRQWFIQNILRRPVFIHELQCEPWGPKAIWEMNREEQDKSMSPLHIEKNIAWAQRIGASPIDFWGAEWWYWLWLHGDKTITKTVENNLT